ncbi:MAG: tetratricopeptide repeat protein, partial [Vicinamibacterales bacterium]
MIRRFKKPGLLFLVAIVAGGCMTGAGGAVKQGDTAARAGNLDEAVVAYRRAVQTEPDNAEYRLALQRSMLAASRAHLARAQQFETQDQLEAAVGEYRLASEYDPSNRMALLKVATLTRAVRARADAARPRP